MKQKPWSWPPPIMQDVIDDEIRRKRILGLAIHETSPHYVRHRIKKAKAMENNDDKFFFFSDDPLYGVDFISISPDIIEVCIQILSEKYLKDRSREDLRPFYSMKFSGNLGL